MKMVKFLAVAALVGITWPALTQAQSTPRIGQRQENQDRRIDQGVASGQLNEREAVRLEKGQAHVQQMEDRALADGTVTKREGARIERKTGRAAESPARSTTGSVNRRTPVVTFVDQELGPLVTAYQGVRKGAFV